MKYLILILTIVSFLSFSSQEDCKLIGNKAKEIMIKRQSQEDVFKTLEIYKHNEEMVLDAYDVPKYDGFKYLANAINASNELVKADERRKFEEENEKYKRAIKQFRLKYIKLCIQSK